MSKIPNDPLRVLFRNHDISLGHHEPDYCWDCEEDFDGYGVCRNLECDQYEEVEWEAEEREWADRERTNHA